MMRCIGNKYSWLFWLLAWQAAAMAAANPLLLPGPVETAEALWHLAGTGELYLNAGWTMFRCISAMLLSFVIGSAAAWCAYKKEWARQLLTLPIGFFKAVPVMAIIIYVVLLASADRVAIIVCFLMCFPVVYTNVLTGLDSMSRELLELAQVYGIKGIKCLKYIYIPGIRPQVQAAVKLIAGLSWKAVVAAEVLSVPKYSLGYEMINAKYYFDTPELFAYIIVIVALSLAFEKIIDLRLKKTAQTGYTVSRLFKGYSSSRLFKGEKDSAKINSRESREPGPEVKLCRISKKYGDKQVLENTNLTFKAGKTTALIGPSGQGKTTIARIIAGLEKDYDGEIRYGGLHKLSFLFQEDRLLPWFNVYDNLSIGLLRENKLPVNKQPENKPADGDAILKMARALEIENCLWKLPEELSGGMRHRVALGRTFLADSNLLILDEPFRGLDEDLKKRIIQRLWKDKTAEKTVLLITHSMTDADSLADSMVKLGEFGEPEELGEPGESGL